MAWFRAASSAAKLAANSRIRSYTTRSIQQSRSRNLHSTAFTSKASTAPVPRPVPLSRLTDSFLDGTSSVYLEELQRAWEADLSSVDESWDNFFRNFVGQAATSPGISGQTIQESMRLLLLVRAYQVNGHLKANLDPLGLEERQVSDVLDMELYGFSEADLDREFFLGVWRMAGFLSENRPVQTLRSILTSLISDTWAIGPHDIKLIFFMGRIRHSSLLLGFSSVAYVLHYCKGLAHPTKKKHHPKVPGSIPGERSDLPGRPWGGIPVVASQPGLVTV